MLISLNQALPTCAFMSGHPVEPIAPSLEDAEDAYQRAMEIALTKGPVVAQQEFIAWLHVVLRNEATSLARRRTREAPADMEVVTAVADRAHPGRDEPAAVAEWKERYRTLQDAMTTLSEAERGALEKLDG